MIWPSYTRNSCGARKGQNFAHLSIASHANVAETKGKDQSTFWHGFAGIGKQPYACAVAAGAARQRARRGEHIGSLQP